jgi:hypothetical protein
MPIGGENSFGENLLVISRIAAIVKGFGAGGIIIKPTGTKAHAGAFVPAGNPPIYFELRLAFFEGGTMPFSGCSFSTGSER